jgi:hypothetical protein
LTHIHHVLLGLTEHTLIGGLLASSLWRAHPRRTARPAVVAD